MSDTIGLVFGRSDAERSALERLIAREDEVFKLQPGEETDHGVHVRADLPRFALFNARQQYHLAMFTRKSDRNFTLTLVGFVVLFIKTGVSWTDILATVSKLFH